MNIDVSLDLYKIFCTVVKTKNMSLAAKELFISQPAVSMAIRQLEDRMGKPLLIRSSKGIRTTSEGAVLFEYLDQALSLIDTAEKKYLEMVNLETGEIRVGAGDTILNKYLLPYIEKFIESYHNINLKITNRTTYETIKLLKSGQVDVGFVNLPIENDENLEIFDCLKIHDIFIAGSKYEYMSKKGISFSHLSDYPLLLLEQDSNSRKYLDQYAAAQGVPLNPNIELGSSDLLVQFAKINLGIGCVAREFTDEEIDNNVLFEIPVNPPVPERAVGMVKLKGVPLSHAAQCFVNILMENMS